MDLKTYLNIFLKLTKLKIKIWLHSFILKI